MCTVSWRRSPGRCDLWFNRDELNTRAAEFPPHEAESSGVRYLAPRDGARGGSWIMVNEFGLTACLLNDYSTPHVPAPDAYSRGFVVLACAASRHPTAVVAAVETLPLERISPFHLLTLSPVDGPLLLHWDGRRFCVICGRDLLPPLSSSSHAPGEVIAERIARFPLLVHHHTDAEYDAFHRQHDPARGAHSVLMLRPDARTRSITRVQVRTDRCLLTYEAVSWHEPAPPPLRMELLRHAG
jgi:hypothetical protein